MAIQLPINMLLNTLNKYNTFVLLDSSLNDAENHKSLVFTQPDRIICAYNPSEVKACLQKMQKEKEKGNYLAGFLSYEAGYAFCSKLYAKQNYTFPLIWMGIFKNVSIYDHKTGNFLNTPLKLNDSAKRKSCKISNLKLSISKKDYIKNVKKIQEFIAAGDTYQVNYTTKLKFNIKGSAIDLYQQLRQNQQVGYGAFIKSREFNILSYSPELFFRQTQDNIFVRPMKGTAPRGINKIDDKKMRNFLHNDPKNRAENIMIVDLLRNDLGKISQTSSVKTTGLFNIEIYKTLLQMTSTIESTLKKRLPLFDLFSSLHPSGSITGAPKIRTMQIIKDLEPQERKIYTGSIGYIAPDNTSVFNVAIRTVLLKDSKGEMGIGGGITYNSDPESEWNECRLKAKFLTQSPFQLIETMRASKKDGIFLLDLHLKRLYKSAKFFAFKYSPKNIQTALQQQISALISGKNYKLRLLLKPSGDIDIKASVLKTQTYPAEILKICISPHRLNSKSHYLYHKTTHRALYNKEFKKYTKQGFYDILFLNEHKEICEGAISNIFLKKNGIYYTPPVHCGLLPGVFREHFIKTHKGQVQEKILTVSDMETADIIYCVNSVRKMVRVKLTPIPAMQQK